MKQPFDSTLESSTATFGRISRAAQNCDVGLTEITITLILMSIAIKFLSYIKHARLRRAYNNYDGLTSASVTFIAKIR